MWRSLKAASCETEYRANSGTYFMSNFNGFFRVLSICFDTGITGRNTKGAQVCHARFKYCKFRQPVPGRIEEENQIVCLSESNVVLFQKGLEIFLGTLLGKESHHVPDRVIGLAFPFGDFPVSFRFIRPLLVSGFMKNQSVGQDIVGKTSAPLEQCL